ncbi:MAG: hypothetical protein QXG00_06465, partial [Candidatus Woesearchaeota archaeon]
MVVVSISTTKSSTSSPKYDVTTNAINVRPTSSSSSPSSSSSTSSVQGGVYYSTVQGWRPANNPNATVVYINKGGTTTGSGYTGSTPLSVQSGVNVQY